MRGSGKPAEVCTGRAWPLSAVGRDTLTSSWNWSWARWSLSGSWRMTSWDDSYQLLMGRTGKDVPIDFTPLLAALLKASEDPEVLVGSSAVGVRVDPGARLPRLPALYCKKKKWRLAAQASPPDCWEETWQRDHSALAEFSEHVTAVMEGSFSISVSRTQRSVSPISSSRPWVPEGRASRRVLFDGTHGLNVRKRTRIRGQERCQMAPTR